MSAEIVEAWNLYRKHARCEIDRAHNRPVGEFPHYSDGERWVTLDALTTSSSKDGLYEHGNWTAGFSVGKMWLGLLNEPDPETEKMGTVQRYAEYFDERSSDHTSHDLGFMFYPSVVLPHVCGMQISGALVNSALGAADSLARRYNTRGNYLQAFGPIGARAWAGTSTIDTMMNLPLLWWASANDARYGYMYEEVARQHSRTAARLALRQDDSTYQLLSFDAASGALVDRGTFQGAGDDSTWARGQAWAIAGLAWSYAACGETELLEAAERSAEFYWSKLPADGVPHWDLTRDTGLPVEDASASAIASLGALILGEFHPVQQRAQQFNEQGRLLLEQLYSAAMREYSGDSGILHRSSYSVPHRKGLSGATPWGDFYLGLALALANGVVGWEILGRKNGEV